MASDREYRIFSPYRDIQHLYLQLRSFVYDLDDKPAVSSYKLKLYGELENLAYSLSVWMDDRVTAQAKELEVPEAGPVTCEIRHALRQDECAYVWGAEIQDAVAFMAFVEDQVPNLSRLFVESIIMAEGPVITFRDVADDFACKLESHWYFGRHYGSAPVGYGRIRSLTAVSQEWVDRIPGDDFPDHFVSVKDAAGYAGVILREALDLMSQEKGEEDEG